MSVITGTFAFGWSEALVDSLQYVGHRVVGGNFDDPFALLLHRIKALKALENSAEVVMVITQHDVEPKHPHVDALLRDLARELLPIAHQGVRCIVVDADPQEYFAKCIADNVPHRLHPDALCPDYLWGTIVRRVQAPAYLADTPALLREFVKKNLSL